MSTEAPQGTAARLGPAADLAEQGFLAAGCSLESAVTILDRLNRRFSACLAELTDTALGETRGGLGAAAAQVATLAESRQSDAATLHSLAGTLAAIHRRAIGLQPITGEVEILSLSARVVAGGMGAVGAVFLAFSANITVAAARCRSSIQHVLDDIGQVEQDLTAARAEATAFTARHGEALQAVPAQLAANLRSLTTQQDLAGQAAAAAQRRSAEVRQAIAAQIVALQLGDITRQRLEHVRKAGQIVTEAGSAGEQAARLLAAQLDDAADELAREGGRIEAGLTQLALAAHAIGELGAQVHGEAAGRHGGFLASLEADIRQTATLFGELHIADAESDRRMAAVMDAAGQLAARLAMVQSVEEDIRIMGLNATIRCGRLGAEGRALAAIAQELRACSGRFAGDAAAALRELDSLRSVAAGLRDPAREAKHAARAGAVAVMLAALQRLGRLERDLAADLAQLQADAGEIGRLVEDAVAQFSVRHTLGATLREVAKAFLSRADDTWHGAAASPRGAEEVLGRIAADYTMAREREVHGRFAPLARQPAVAAPVAADTAELADILF